MWKVFYPCDGQELKFYIEGKYKFQNCKRWLNQKNFIWNEVLKDSPFKWAPTDELLFFRGGSENQGGKIQDSGTKIFRNVW